MWYHTGTTRPGSRWSPVTSREGLGWRIPRSERDSFVQFVEEKWGCTDTYVRFELESAMREFLDKDDILYEAEQLLRDHLKSQGLSSSPPVIPDERTDHSDTVQLGYRVNSELKAEFAAFAKQHYDQNFGAILTRALNSYRDGGRRRRVLEKIHHLVTSGIAPDTTTDADENADHMSRGDESLNQESPQSGGSAENLLNSQSLPDQYPDTATPSDDNADVDAMAVSEIAGKLGDCFTREELMQAIAKTQDGNPETIELYTEAVTAYENVVEHPANDALFIPEEKRAEITVYSDLDLEERAEKLRKLIIREALKKQVRFYQATYTEVQDLFDEDLDDAPSHDYAYTLMEAAAEESGFAYEKRNGQKQLCLDLQPVQRHTIEEVADHPEVGDLNVDSSENKLESTEETDRSAMST